MLPAVAYVVVLATLFCVAAYAITTSYLAQRHFDSARGFYSAKNCRGPVRLAWSFFASGMGSWTLCTFTEIGVYAGSWGVIGYTLSGCLGMLILAIAGPATRALLGDGVTLTDYILNRYGRAMQLFVMIVSVHFQFISLASELTCIGDLVIKISGDASKVVPVLGVAVFTNTYTSIGGFRASLSTDVCQGIGVLFLVLVVAIVMMFHVTIPEHAWHDTKVAALTTVGFETLVTLCIASTAANLFFTGFWQRVYAAKDDESLRKACLYSCFMIIPFTVVLALAGMVTSLAYPNIALEAEPNYFFPILLDMGTFWQVLVLMVIASLASSVSDSIQIGISAELVTNFPFLKVWHARIVCVLLNIPAIILALKGIRVLKLFLIADLLCTAAVGPMLLGVWKHSHRHAALAGCFSGLLTIFVCGIAMGGGTFADGIKWFTLPKDLYAVESMITFIVTLIVPILVTVLGSLLLRRSNELATSINASPKTYNGVQSPVGAKQRVSSFSSA